MKLTDAQRALLSELAVRTQAVSGHYPPAVALVRRDLAEWVPHSYGDMLEITEAGRQALKGSEG